MVMNEIESKIDKRLMRWETSPRPLETVMTAGRFTVVAQRGYQGLRDDRNTLTVPPVYDTVIAGQSAPVCGLSVDGRIALADCATGRLLTEFLYDAIVFRPDGMTVEVVRGSKRGLYDTVANKLEIAPDDEYVAQKSGGRFTWSYTPGEGYTFHNLETGRKIVAGNNIELCFDEAYGHIFGIFEGRVSVVTDEGLRDDAAYRDLLVRLRGRIELSNYDRGIHIVADIYGNVL